MYSYIDGQVASIYSERSGICIIYIYARSLDIISCYIHVYIAYTQQYVCLAANQASLRAEKPAEELLEIDIRM